MAKEKVSTVIPEEGIPPEGYSQEEWDDLTPTEKQGVLIGIPSEEPGAEEGGNGGPNS